jgi:hypothetical protein
MRLPTQLFFFKDYYFETTSEWNWKALLVLILRLSCDRILGFKDAIANAM